jgi:hypothetical protein
MVDMTGLEASPSMPPILSPLQPLWHMSTGAKGFVASEAYHGQYSRGRACRQEGGGEAYRIEGSVERVNPRVSAYLYTVCAAVGPPDTALSNALEDRNFTTNV